MKNTDFVILCEFYSILLLMVVLFCFFISSSLKSRHFHCKSIHCVFIVLDVYAAFSADQYTRKKISFFFSFRKEKERESKKRIGSMQNGVHLETMCVYLVYFKIQFDRR